MKSRVIISLMVALTMLAQLVDVEPWQDVPVLLSSSADAVAHAENESPVALPDAVDTAVPIETALAPAPLVEILPTILLVASFLTPRTSQHIDRARSTGFGPAPPHLAARQHFTWLRISLLRI